MFPDVVCVPYGFCTQNLVTTFDVLRLQMYAASHPFCSGSVSRWIPDVCCIRLALLQAPKCMLHDVGSTDVVCIPLAASALLWRCSSGMMGSWQAR